MAGTSVQSRRILKGIMATIQVLVNIIVYTVLILAIAKIAFWTYHFSYQIYGNVTVESAPGRDVTVEIEEQEGTMEIASDLYEKETVIDKYSFFIRMKLTTGKKRPILPGTYTLNTSMTYEEILDILTKEVSAETSGE